MFSDNLISFFKRWQSLRAINVTLDKHIRSMNKSRKPYSHSLSLSPSLNFKEKLKQTWRNCEEKILERLNIMFSI